MKPIPTPPQVDDFSADAAEDPDSLAFTLSNDHITFDACAGQFMARPADG